MESFIIAQLKNIIALVDSNDELKNSVEICKLLSRKPTEYEPSYLLSLQTEEKMMDYLNNLPWTNADTTDMVAKLYDDGYHSASIALFRISNYYECSGVYEKYILDNIKHNRTELLKHTTHSAAIGADELDYTIEHGTIDVLKIFEKSIKNKKVSIPHLIKKAVELNKKDMVLYLVGFL